MVAPVLLLLGVLALSLVALRMRDTDRITNLRSAIARRRDEGAMGGFGLASGLAIVGLIIGAVVGMKILGVTAPLYFDGLNETVTAFSNGTTGDTDADALLPIFKFVLALGGLVAIALLGLLIVQKVGK